MASSYMSPLLKVCRGVALAAGVATLCAGCTAEQPAQLATDDVPAPPAPIAGVDGDPASGDASSATKDAAEASVPSDAGASATTGGDGSEITLSPLSAQDIDGAALAGELACAFSIDAAAPLLLANGDVASDEPARGVVKVGDYVEAVAATGGFDAMLRGARFAGAGKTVTIAVTGAPVGGGESPPMVATLTYDRADGARRVFTGHWRCGP